ncbi:MAG TPA: hypothetical protein DCQ31_13420 [Bacteroidales bacterium]|nr:hypothetical protein [Bacteroidales bacterium]
MKILQNQSIVVRISIFVAVAFLLLFSILGYFLWSAGKQSFLNTENLSVNKDFDFIQEVLNNDIQASNKILDNAENFANVYLLDPYRFSISNYRTDSAVIINELSDLEKHISMPVWEMNDELLYKNNEFVTNFTKISGCNLAVFQKIPGGYLRIASNIPSLKPNSGTGYYVPVTDERAVAIANNEAYESRFIFKNELHLTTCRPIIFEDEIVGFFQLSAPVNPINSIQKQFADYKLYETGVLFMVNEAGKILFHPTEKGKDISHDIQMEQLLANKEFNSRGFFSYSDPNFGPSKINVYYLYLTEFKVFAVITFPADEYFIYLDKFRNIIVLYLLFALLAFLFTSIIAFRHLTSKVHEITNVLYSIALGSKGKKIDSQYNDEIGKIVQAANAVSDNIENVIDFATKLENGNLDAKFTPKSENDLLGIALDKMRNSLSEMRTAESERRQKELFENRRHEGVSRFNELIRHQSDDMGNFGFIIIKNLTEFFDANQAGIFLVRTNSNNEQYIELIATYAYNRRRMTRKTIPADEGILGRVLAEKKTIYITEVPDDYLEITSGLGYEKPKSLAIVPLKTNDVVIGMIELASFNTFDEFTLGFLEEIADIIAKTISLAENNIKTMRLLVESKSRSEEMAAQEEEMRQNLEELIATQEESARREAERDSLMQAIYEASHLFEFDLKGTLTNVNRNLAQVLGYSLKELIGLKHSEISSEGENDLKYANFWQLVLDGIPQHMNEVFTFDDGSIFTAETSYTTIKNYDDTPSKVLCIIKNIIKKS